MKKSFLWSFLIFSYLFLGIVYSESITQANVSFILTETLQVSNSEEVAYASILYPFGERIQDLFVKGKCTASKEGDFLKILFQELNEGENECEVLINVNSHLKMSIPANSLWDEKEALKETEHITLENEVSVLGNLILDKCKEDFWCNVREGVKEVHTFMQYDSSLGDKNYDVKFIVKQRKGVCAEYVTLFIALMRYLHIPAIYVSSYAYNGESYEPHAFAYVFNEKERKWYVVDVLWKQIGYVDASHVFIGWSYDNEVKSKLEAKASPSSNISWKKESMSVRSYDFLTSNLFNAVLEEVYKLPSYSDSSEEYIFSLKLESAFPACGEVSIVPCSYDGLSKKEDILCGGEVKNFSFVIDLRDEGDYVFTCPFNIYDPEHDNYSYNLTIEHTIFSKKAWYSALIEWLINLFKHLSL
ncbi:MAG: transglutaminase domain-containing protein [Candidatus Nanohaloarchaeota archaeon]|nr:transglutaminase domain-containing protein [Candidatus Nanohaloarchaeota archaeon]